VSSCYISVKNRMQQEATVVGGRHWSPVRIGSLRCNKINSQRDTVGGRGCGSWSHADYVSDDQENWVRARLSDLDVFNAYIKVDWKFFDRATNRWDTFSIHLHEMKFNSLRWDRWFAFAWAKNKILLIIQFLDITQYCYAIK